MVNHKKIEEDTVKYGGQWGYMHTRRLLKLIEIISENNLKKTLLDYFNV